MTSRRRYGTAGAPSTARAWRASRAPLCRSARDAPATQRGGAFRVRGRRPLSSARSAALAAADDDFVSAFNQFLTVRLVRPEACERLIRAGTERGLYVEVLLVYAHAVQRGALRRLRVEPLRQVLHVALIREGIHVAAQVVRDVAEAGHMPRNMAGLFDDFIQGEERAPSLPRLPLPTPLARQPLAAALPLPLPSRALYACPCAFLCSSIPFPVDVCVPVRA